MQFDLERLIGFFDNPKLDHKVHASALVGFFGEELCLAAYIHYLERCGLSPVRLAKQPTQVKDKGKKLDAWIAINSDDNDARQLHQCEVKSWTAASSRKSFALAIDADDAKVTKIARALWDVQRETFFEKTPILPEKEAKAAKVVKVLFKMKRPEEFSGAKIKPVLIYWRPVWGGEGLAQPCFDHPLNDFKLPREIEAEPFEKLTIFSTSLYLRALCKEGPHFSLTSDHIRQRAALFSEICGLRAQTPDSSYRSSVRA